MTDGHQARLAHIRNLHHDHALPCTHEERGLLFDEIDRLNAELDRQPLLTCGASLSAGVVNPIGPCVLRHNHDGPVHQDATGCRWWNTTTFATGAGPTGP